MKEHLEFGRTEQKQHTRSRILMAAHRLLESGNPLTMEDIAKEARVSRATIYRYYSNIDSLSTELVLHLNLPNPDTLITKYKNEPLDTAFLGIQQHYLNFILANENASRKFLEAFLSSSDPQLERGQNRISTVRKYLASQDIELDPSVQEKLVRIAVLLMGIEAVITSKDVCGLSNAETKETLEWALKMMLKGCLKP